MKDSQRKAIHAKKNGGLSYYKQHGGGKKCPVCESKFTTKWSQFKGEPTTYNCELCGAYFTKNFGKNT